MMQNKIEGAMDLLNMIVCRRQREMELEAKEKPEEEKTEIHKSEEVHNQQETEEKGTCSRSRWLTIQSLIKKATDI